MIIQDSLVEQSTQGTFVPHGRDDILNTAIGKKDHPGRVRTAGYGVGIRKFFGLAAKPSQSSTAVPSQQYEQMKEQIRHELRDELEQMLMQKLSGQQTSTFTPAAPSPGENI